MMDKDETGLRGHHGGGKELEDDTMRKSFRGVIDETADEIMNSFASLVLKSDELLRMTMDGSAGKLGDAFDDDISSCYEEFDDDNDDDDDDDDNNNNNNNGGNDIYYHPLNQTTVDKLEKFESFKDKNIVHHSLSYRKPATRTPSPPPVIFHRSSDSASPPPRNNNNSIPSNVSSTGGSTTLPKNDKKDPAAVATSDNVKPKRPLSAYNLYFQLERERLIAGVDPEEPFTAEDVKRIAIQRRELEQDPGRPKRKHRKSHGKISFAELARRIADKWKTLTPEAKDLLQERAAIEKTRYLRELEEWTKYNNTSADGIYSPKATNSGEPSRCPETPMPAPIYMPPQFINQPPRRADCHTGAGGGLIFHRQSYPRSLSPIPRMHPDSISRSVRDSPPSCWMMVPQYEQPQPRQLHTIPHRTHGQQQPFPPSFLQQHEQQQHQQQRYPFMDESYPYEPRPALVSASNSFDSTFDAAAAPPQDLTLEASALAERFGWSTSSVLEMMRELDQKRRPMPRALSSVSDDSDDGADHVPRGVLDEVRFTPI